MSTRKAVSNRTAPILPVLGSLQTAPDETVRERLLDDVEVKSLSIGDDFDSGGDPYNSTGQFVVLQANTRK
jgi:hypothetical protein